MKAFYIPTGILVIILGFSLWTGHYVDQRTDHWVTLLEQVDDTGRREDWTSAQNSLDEVYRDWNSCQTFFHTIMEHDTLDETELLFQGAIAVCEERDDADFHLMLAQLMAQLQHMAETQSSSIKNIL